MNGGGLSREVFQERLVAYLKDSGILSGIKIRVRRHLIDHLKASQDGDDTLYGPVANKNLSPKYKAINLLVADYLLQQGYQYVLSLFSLEDPSMAVITERTKIVKIEEGQRKTVTAFKFVDSDVLDILETLGFVRNSKIVNEVRSLYVDSFSNDPFIVCLLKCLSNRSINLFHNIKDVNFNSAASQTNLDRESHLNFSNRSVDIDDYIYNTYEEMKTAFDKELEIVKMEEQKKFEEACKLKDLKIVVLKKELEEKLLSIKKSCCKKVKSLKEELTTKEKYFENERHILVEQLRMNMHKNQQQQQQQQPDNCENTSTECQTVPVVTSSRGVQTDSLDEKSQRSVACQCDEADFDVKSSKPLEDRRKSHVASSSVDIDKQYRKLQSEYAYLTAFNEQQKLQKQDLLNKYMAISKEVVELRDTLQNKSAVDDLNNNSISKRSTYTIDDESCNTSSDGIDEMKETLRKLELEGEQFDKAYKNFKQRQMENVLRKPPSSSSSSSVSRFSAKLYRAEVDWKQNPDPYNCGVRQLAPEFANEAIKTDFKDDTMSRYKFLNRVFVDSVEPSQTNRAFGASMNFDKNLLQNYVETSLSLLQDDTKPRSFADTISKRNIAVSTSISDIPSYTNRSHFENKENSSDAKSHCDESATTISSTSSSGVNVFETKKRDALRRWSLPSAMYRKSPLSHKSIKALLERNTIAARSDPVKRKLFTDEANDANNDLINRKVHTVTKDKVISSIPRLVDRSNQCDKRSRNIVSNASLIPRIVAHSKDQIASISKGNAPSILSGDRNVINNELNNNKTSVVTEESHIPQNNHKKNQTISSLESTMARDLINDSIHTAIPRFVTRSPDDIEKNQSVCLSKSPIVQSQQLPSDLKNDSTHSTRLIIPNSPDDIEENQSVSSCNNNSSPRDRFTHKEIVYEIPIDIVKNPDDINADQIVLSFDDAGCSPIGNNKIDSMIQRDSDDLLDNNPDASQKTVNATPYSTDGRMAARLSTIETYKDGGPLMYRLIPAESASHHTEINIPVGVDEVISVVLESAEDGEHVNVSITSDGNPRRSSISLVTEEDGSVSLPSPQITDDNESDNFWKE